MLALLPRPRCQIYYSTIEKASFLLLANSKSRFATSRQCRCGLHLLEPLFLATFLQHVHCSLALSEITVMLPQTVLQGKILLYKRGGWVELFCGMGDLDRLIGMGKKGPTPPLSHCHLFGVANVPANVPFLVPRSHTGTGTNVIIEQAMGETPRVIPPAPSKSQGEVTT